MSGVPHQAAIDADFAARLKQAAADIREGMDKLPIALPAFLTNVALRIAQLSFCNADALLWLADAFDEIPAQMPIWRERYPVSRHPELANALLLQIGDCAADAANHLRQLAPLYDIAADEGSTLFAAATAQE